MRKYSLGIIAIYAALTPLFFIFPPSGVGYGFRQKNLAWTALIFLFSLFIFLVFSVAKGSGPKIKLAGVAWVILYGIVIAFPEEIIFRGIIQNFLQVRLGNIGLAILISSAIFGLVHLPNGAKSFRPKDWNWQLAALAFAGGLPLGLIFFLTNSLLLPTILHALFVICMQLFLRGKIFGK